MRAGHIYAIIIFITLLPAAVFSQTATMSGTVFTNNNEDDIRAGGQTISVELEPPLYWVDAVGDDSDATTGLIKGFSGDENWDVVSGSLDHTHVTRVNNSLVTIELPEVSAYFIPQDESVKLTIPAICLFFYGSQVTASPDLKILNQEPVITVSGSIQDGTANTEPDIRNGNSNIILNLDGDQWNSLVGGDNNLNGRFVRGISGSTSWNNDVVNAILGGDHGATNVSVTGQEITITIPSVPDYQISETDNISIEVNNEALDFTDSGPIAATPGLSVQAASTSATINDPGLTESTIDGAVLRYTLIEETFNTTSFIPGDFSHNGPSDITIDNANYISDTEADVTLGFSGDLTGSLSFNITAASSVLTGGNPITSNSITISSETNPTITDVTIVEGVYGIGDTVEVLISVTDDGGAEYTYFKGTVAGRSLEFIEKQSNTLYRAGFEVAEGDNEYSSADIIPVTGVQLASGSLLSNEYSGNISNNTIIDTSRPTLEPLQLSSGQKKIGDQVDLIVQADASGYSAVEANTRVNNVPITRTNVSLIPLGSGLYILRYIVAKGDNDVSPGDLTASLQLHDASGNRSDIQTQVSVNTVSIDANPPNVGQITVTDGIYNIGDIIEVSIIADGTNYTSTNDTYINGVPITSSDVSFSNVSGNQYRLLYTVRSVDPEVAPGELDIALYLRDAAGNVSDPFTTIEPNSLAIYTNLPSAIISGNQDVCEGEDAVLTVNLTGNPPWRLYLSDGAGNQEYTGINESPYQITVNPVANTIYTIDSLFDSNNTKNIGTGSANVTVREKTDVEIVNLNSSYFIEADPVLLQGQPAGGVFSGPGVVNGYFDPAVADTVDSPHTLYYNFTNIYGCVSTDSALVFVLGAQGDLFIPKEIYCDYEEAFTVSASNTAGATGTFTLKDELGNPVSGLTDNGDNTASVDPGQLSPGDYEVEYEYLDQVTFTLTETFQIEEVETPEITSPVETTFCQNASSISLEGSIAGAVFEGTGVYGNTEDGFVFIPDSALAGSNIVTLTNTSVHGCEKSSSIEIQLNAIPDVGFSVDKLCVSSRDTVFFTNITNNISSISNWLWDFGDPDSGDENTSQEESPYHIYDTPGLRTITLIGETEEGCRDSLATEIEFGDNPHGTFTWDNECFEDGQRILFTSNVESSNEITSYQWTFVEPFGDPVSLPGEDTISYIFDEMDTYRVKLYTETSIGCNKTIERMITLKPVITVADDEAYQENFTGGDGWWSADQDNLSDNLSWNYNTVDFSNLNGEASGGWLTELPDEAIIEDSWVKSPCFDFSGIERPMISFDSYNSLEKDSEGVVLQATTNGGQEWETVGTVNSGVNWYNSSGIDPGPAGQSKGWTGRDPFSADTGWIDTRHDLDRYAGESRVQFRFAFASNHESSIAEREGFAFDNVRIERRNKKVLLEHFTNTSSDDTREINGIVNNLYNSSFNDVVKLEYHTSFPGPDPFNQHNTSAPATRAFYYGISTVPYSVLDGGSAEFSMFNYDPDMLEMKNIKQKSLTNAGFDIDINANYTQDQVSGSVEVTSLRVQPQAERIIHIVVYEKLIEGISTQNGAVNFLNVVKKMLPNSAGTAVFGGWNLGQTQSFSFSWDFENVYDPEMIRIAAFIQNDETREIYQVSSDDTTNLTTSVRNIPVGNLAIRIYPQPANEYLILEIMDGKDSEYEVALMDQSGRGVLRTNMRSFEKSKRIALDRFPAGIYFLKVREKDGTAFNVEKILVF